ncbi:MAG: hypothetical protein ACYCWW_05325 [Deltaproteobacteria bacterium]
MPLLWMGVTPGWTYTRVLLLDESGQALLKARLPPEPGHPRALELLCEALALWSGRRLRVAVAADNSDASSAGTRWLDTFDAISRSPLCQFDFVSCARPKRVRDGLCGMGDFHDVRQLWLFGRKQ